MHLWLLYAATLGLCIRTSSKLWIWSRKNSLFFSYQLVLLYLKPTISTAKIWIEISFKGMLCASQLSVEESRNALCSFIHYL